MTPRKIVLVEDHRNLRGIIRALLQSEPGFEVVGEAANGKEALHVAKEWKPDVWISDLRMEAMDGLELTREIHGLSPATRVIIWTMHGDPFYVVQAMAAGASGCMLNGDDSRGLLQAIEAVASGKSYLSPSLSTR